MRLHLLLGCPSLVLTSCGGGGGSSARKPTPEPTATDHSSHHAPVAVTLLTPTSATVKVGETVALQLATCYPIEAPSDPEGCAGLPRSTP
jgi:hypothetical protein